MRTEEERLAGYRLAFLEKVKKWNWSIDDDDYKGKPRGRKSKIIKPKVDLNNPRNKFKNKL
jgi:hypothetical protein